MTYRILPLAVFLLPCPALLADMVVLSNGDKVSGTLVEVNSSRVVIDSPLMGSVKLLRTDVRSIRFGSPQEIQADIEKENAAVIKEATKKALAERVAVKNAGANKPIAPAALGAARPPVVNPILQGNPQGILQAGNIGALLGGQGDPELDAAMNQLKQIFPAAGNPAMQNQLQGQLLKVIGGQLGVGDIRNQAADASKELRAAKRDLQQIGAWSPIYDMYLGILDDFVGRADAGEGLER